MIVAAVGLAMAVSSASAAPLRVGLTVPVLPAPQPASDDGSEDARTTLASLGSGAVRYAGETPFGWAAVQPAEDVWNFTDADAAIDRAGPSVIVPLFDGSSPSLRPPWTEQPAHPAEGIGPEAKRYIEAVVGRYSSAVRHWEIGDAVAPWRLVDESVTNASLSDGGAGRASDRHAERMGAVSAEIASLVRRSDPDAVVVMRLGGSAGVDPRRTLAAFFRGAGSGAFDALAYGETEDGFEHRAAILSALGPRNPNLPSLWRVESGPVSTLDTPATQVVKRTVAAWAAGDQAVVWFGGPKRTPTASADAEHEANQRLLRRFASHLEEFEAITELPGLRRGQFGYHFRLSNGTNRWLMWGRGTMRAPSDPYAKGMTVLDPSGTGRWGPVPERIALTSMPVLLRD